MAKYFLLNPVLVAAGRLLWPGTLVDDAQENLAAISAKGGRLYPASNATVAAGAAEADRIKRGGGTVERAASVMSQAAATADASAGGGPSRVTEVLFLQYGYSNHAQALALTPEFSAGSAIDDAGPFEAHWLLAVPQVVVGDNQADVMEGRNVTSAGPAVTVTVYGVDARGNAQSCSFATNGANVYQAAEPRAFRLPLHRVTTSANLGRKLCVYTGKGIGTASAFDPDTFEMGQIGFMFSRDEPTYLHGPSGTVVPGGEWNSGEPWVYMRYKPVP